MHVVYTEQAIRSLQEALDFIASEVTEKKYNEIRDKILDTAESLASQPHLGQEEPVLEHLGLGHRRLIEGNYKIIYRITKECIYITDIFDTRQDPSKMKG